MARLESKLGRTLAFLCSVLPVVAGLLASEGVRQWAHKKGPWIMSVSTRAAVLLALELPRVCNERDVLQAMPRQPR